MSPAGMKNNKKKKDHQQQHRQGFVSAPVP
jgi:hypothetical protein